MSYEGFQDVFENFQDVFFVIHYNEKNEQVDFVMSPSVEKTFGYTVDEIKQLNFTEFHARPNEREAFFKLMKVDKRVKNYPLILKKKDGTKLHVEADCEFIHENLPKNAVFGLRGVVKDVTKRYKENLRSDIAYLIAAKSQRRLTNIKLLSEFIYNSLNEVMDISNFYIALLNEEDDTLYMPIFIDEYYEAHVNEITIPIDNGLTEYIIRSKKVIVEDKKGLRKLIKKEGLTLRGELSECFVGVPLKSEGKYFGLIVMQSYKEDYHFGEEDIELLKFISMQIAYVLERTQWQETLIKKEQHYRSLVENSSEIIGIIGKDGILKYASESIKRITGYGAMELIGKNISDLIITKDILKIIKSKFLKSSNNKLELLEILDKKGNKKYLEVSLNKYKNDELIFNAKDITQRVILDRENEFAQKRLNTLHQIERALLSDKPLANILDDSLKVITNNLFDVDRAGVGLYNYTEKKVEIVALRTKYKNKNGIRLGESIPFDELASHDSISKNRPFYIEDLGKLDTLKDSDLRDMADGILSYYVMPIVINNKVIGTFNFGSKIKDNFKKIDKELVQEITSLVAVVINDALLKKEIEQRDNDLTTIFNSSNEGIVKVSKEGQFLFVNERFCKMLGYTEKEMLTKTFSDITFKEDIETSDKSFNDLKKKKIPHLHLEKRFEDKTGNVLECEVSVRPAFDDKNDIDYLIAFIYDKTEEKKALKQVTDIKNALNHTALVFFTNYKGYITDVNEKLEQVSGYKRDEIIGSSVKIFNSNYHSKKWWNNVWDTIKSGETWQGEIKNEKKDGSVFWVFSTITPVLDKKGNIEHFISIQLDITKEKEFKSNSVREVIEAQEQERERFAMEIHDGLGQVLLATKMNLSAMQDSCSGLDNESKIILNNSVDLLTDAVQEARNISHGLMSRVLNRFGLAFAVSEIINNINNTSDLKFVYKHNIEKFRFIEEIEMGVYRTLQELIKNIIKHSKATKANLDIMRKEDKLFIEIKDNGIGIEKGTVNNPRTSGIGLRNMRSRVEYLGGVFEIDSKIKKGTKINIRISF